MAKTKERPRCFYCGDPVLPSRVERDHFPVPESAGGVQTVDACPQCHDLKDRTNWRDLPPELKAEFLQEFAGMGRASKIVVAQLLRAGYELKPATRSVRIHNDELGEIADVIASEADLATQIAKLAYPLLRDGLSVTLRSTLTP